MKFQETFNIGKITSGLQKGLKQGVGAVKKGATVVKDKTGQIGRQGAEQLTALQKKSKESIKKVFKRAA
jgi:hypothetical protein